MKNNPRLMTNAETESIVERLKREGRFPSPQQLLEAIKTVRREYQFRIMAAREAASTPMAVTVEPSEVIKITILKTS
jgi:hypothetical protein